MKRSLIARHKIHNFFQRSWVHEISQIMIFGEFIFFLKFALVAPFLFSTLIDISYVKNFEKFILKF